jgi:hypothetical protein
MRVITKATAKKGRRTGGTPVFITAPFAAAGPEEISTP